MRSIDITEIIEDISSDLENKLVGVGEKVNPNTLKIIVKSVVKELIQKREYPSSMSDEDVLSDLESYYATIFKVAEYDYNMIGAEGELKHSENGVDRTYLNRDRYFDDVYKFVRVLA